MRQGLFYSFRKALFVSEKSYHKTFPLTPFLNGSCLNILMIERGADNEFS